MIQSLFQCWEHSIKQDNIPASWSLHLVKKTDNKQDNDKSSEEYTRQGSEEEEGEELFYI